jgi:hypothetical protein
VSFASLDQEDVMGHTWTLTKGIEKDKQKYEDANKNDADILIVVAVTAKEGKAGRKQGENHAWIGRQKQESPPVHVDPPIRWESEEEVGQAETPAQPESSNVSRAVAIDVLDEHCRVEGENIPAASQCTSRNMGCSGLTRRKAAGRS